MNADHRSQLSAYLDGELTPEERAEIERALSSDPALRRELEELRALAADLARLPTPRPPPSLLAGVLARIDSIEQSNGVESDRMPSVPLAAPERPVVRVVDELPPELPAANEPGAWARWGNPLSMLAAACLAVGVGWNLLGRNASLSPPPPSALVAARPGEVSGVLAQAPASDSVRREEAEPAQGGEGAAPRPTGGSRAKRGGAKVEYAPYAPEWEAGDAVADDAPLGRGDAAPGEPPASSPPTDGPASTPKAAGPAAQGAAASASQPSTAESDGDGVADELALEGVEYEASEKKSRARAADADPMASSGASAERLAESSASRREAPAKPAPMPAAAAAPPSGAGAAAPAEEARALAHATLHTELSDALAVLRTRAEARGWSFRVVRGGGALSSDNPRHEVEVVVPAAQAPELQKELATVGRVKIDVPAGAGGAQPVRVVVAWGR